MIDTLLQGVIFIAWPAQSRHQNIVGQIDLNGIRVLRSGDELRDGWIPGIGNVDHAPAGNIVMRGDEVPAVHGPRLSSRGSPRLRQEREGSTHHGGEDRGEHAAPGAGLRGPRGGREPAAGAGRRSG